MVDLIFDGDSITDFWMGPGKGVWAKNYGRLNAVDYGISGDRTGNMLWRLEHGQVAYLHPRLVAIMIGTNNTGECTDVQIAEGVTAVVRAYEKLCPTAVILLQAIFPRAESPTDPTREKITRVNRIISSLGDGKKVVYVDFGDKFLQPDGTINRDLMPDTSAPQRQGLRGLGGRHPTRAGQSFRAGRSDAVRRRRTSNRGCKNHADETSDAGTPRSLRGAGRPQPVPHPRTRPRRGTHLGRGGWPHLPRRSGARGRARRRDHRRRPSQPRCRSPA